MIADKNLTQKKGFSWHSAEALLKSLQVVRAMLDTRSGRPLRMYECGCGEPT
jgi:hypothetical protein